MRLILLFALLVISPAVAPAAEPVAGLIARTLAAYGGEALPRRGELMRQTGQTFSAVRGATGAMRREASWPDYLRIDIAYADGARESRVMIGTQGWRDGAPAPAALVAAMRLQAARLALPMILDWESSTISDLGPATVEGGVAVRRLALDLGAGLTLFVEIETAGGRILRSAGVMRAGDAKMDFGAVYGPLRPFGALRWPEREEQSAMGRPTGWTVIETVETGLPLDRDALRP